MTDVSEESLDESVEKESEEVKGTSSEVSGSRDLMVSTLMHLMGLPTSKSLDVVEAKLDALTSKVTALSLKLDRMMGEDGDRDIDMVLERIEYQVSDLRSLIKKVLPSAIAKENLVSGNDDTE